MLDKKSVIIHSVFVAIQIILTSIFLFADLTTRAVCGLNFSVVATAFLHAIVTSGKSPHKKVFLTAMAFTVVSDIFLTLRFMLNENPTDQLVAMFTFSVTQICYAIYLYLQSDNKTLKKISVAVRVVVSILIMVISVVVLKDAITTLVVVTMFYFVNLVFNAIFAFIEFKRNPLLAIGLLFFIFCDIIIGLGVMRGMFPKVEESNFIYQLVYSFSYSWLFYSISQTLISLSISQNLAFLRKGEKQIKKVKSVYHR